MHWDALSVYLKSVIKKYFKFLSGFAGIYIYFFFLFIKGTVAVLNIPGFSLFLPSDGE